MNEYGNKMLERINYNIEQKFNLDIVTDEKNFRLLQSIIKAQKIANIALGVLIVDVTVMMIKYLWS